MPGPDWWYTRKSQEPATPAPSLLRPCLSVEAARLLAERLGATIAGIGCLTGNLGAAAEQCHRLLATGGLTEDVANGLTETLASAHQEVEAACRLVSQVRADLEPRSAPNGRDHA